MRQLVIVLALIAAVSATGCAAGWKGKTRQDLIYSKGYPMEKRSVGGGTEVWVYPSLPGFEDLYWVAPDGRIVNYKSHYAGGL